MNELEGEEELHRYVDGELPPDRRAAVEARLREDPEAAAAVSAWQRQNALIRALYGTSVGEAAPSRLHAVLRTAPRRGRWRALAAGAALFLLGGAAGWMLRDPLAPSSTASLLAARSLEAHKVYVAEVRHPVEVGASEEAHLVQWLSKRLGYALRAPDLSGQGLRLLGGRLLPGPKGPAALLMYEAEDGRRYTFYCARTSSHAETAFRFVEGNDAAAFYWIDGHAGYALVGPQDRERLLRIARAVYEAFEGRTPQSSNSGPRTL